MTGCYKCGSESGNEVRLCPTCTEDRLAGRERLSQFEAEDDVLDGRYPLPAVLGGITLIALLVLWGIWSNRSYIRMKMGKMTADDVYEICLDGAGKVASEAKDEASKALASGFMVAMCEEIQKSCKTDANGQQCRQAKDLIRVMAKAR